MARNFQAARHDATQLTKALSERAPPTSKGCRRLAASSRLAERCSAESSCDSALPAHYGSGLASGIGHVKASDPQACRDPHPVSLHPIRVLRNKIANLARARSSVMAVVPGGGGSPSIVATTKRPTKSLSSTAPVLISSAKCFRNDLGSSGLPV